MRCSPHPAEARDGAQHAEHHLRHGCATADRCWVEPRDVGVGGEVAEEDDRLVHRRGLRLRGGGDALLSVVEKKGVLARGPNRS